MKGWPRNWMKKIDLIADKPVSAQDINLDLLANRIETLRTEA